MAALQHPYVFAASSHRTASPKDRRPPGTQSKGRLLLSAAKPDFSVSPKEKVLGTIKGTWERTTQP